MKKTLIALAVASALPAVAMAQNISISGGIDTNVTVNDDGANSTTQVRGDGWLYSSRIQFKGSEDLGGGLKASFMLESRLTTDTGKAGNQAVGVSSASNVLTSASLTGGVFNGEASVSLAGGFGSVKLGKFSHAIEGIDSAANATGTNLALSGNDSTFDKVDNTFEYTSPKLAGGLTLSVAQSQGETAGTSTGNITSYTAIYSAGPITLAAGMGDKKESASTDYSFTAVGAKYSMGPAQFGVTFNTADPAADNLKRKNTIASVGYDLGGGLSVVGAYTIQKQDVASTTAKTGKSISIALLKALSKRTTAYVGYASTKNTNDGTFVVNDQVSPAANGDATLMTVGVRHMF